MKKITLFILILSLVFIPIASKAEGQKKRGLSLLIERALKNNPEIKAAMARLDASQARIPQAGAWDDPRVFAKFVNIPIDNPSFSRTPMTGKEFGIQQRIPVSGTKGAAKKAASFEAKAANEDALDTIAQVIWILKDRYYELAAVNTSIYITQKNKKVADELVNVTRSRFESRKETPAQDVLKAQLDYGGYTDQLYYLYQAKKSLVAEIEAIVADGRSIKSPGGSALHRGIKKFRKRDVSQFTNEHPRVKKRLALMQAAEKNVSLARRKVFPDFDLSFSWRQRNNAPGDVVNGEDFFTAGVSIPLPIFAGRKQLKHVDENKALLSESKANFNNIQNKIQYELRDAFAKYERARREISLLSSALIPQSQEAMKTSLAEYETGKVEFINVLTAQLATYRYEIDLIQARADRARQSAKLEYLLAGPK